MNRLKGTLRILAALVCFGGVSAFAQTATFSFDDLAGTPNAGSYNPGDSFTIAINLIFTPGGTVDNLAGLSYWFEQSTPGAPFNFAITNRNATGSSFTDLQTPGLTYPQGLSPQNTSDLGAFKSDLIGVGAGNYFIANLTFSIANTATPGTYVIEDVTTNGKKAVISDDQGDTFAVPQAIYTITVVPEPATWIAAGLVAMSLAGARRLRRGAR